MSAERKERKEDREDRDRAELDMLLDELEQAITQLGGAIEVLDNRLQPITRPLSTPEGGMALLDGGGPEGLSPIGTAVALHRDAVLDAGSRIRDIASRLAV
jgi:hypothetical protein